MVGQDNMKDSNSALWNEDVQAMILNPERITNREKLILAGMYLSKFDSDGLERLGFHSFVEAYNVIGYALGSQPASIKNYRDEFDPLFPNRRKGWHKRPIRANRLKVFEEYQSLNSELFTGLIKSFLGYDENVSSEVQETEEREEGPSGFAKRLITGLAAEQYFESVQCKLPEFQAYALENTTRLGCGYDFRLTTPKENDFLAIEVKGLREQTGSISLTPREHEAAAAMRNRFYLFVVRNFQKTPNHDIFLNPLESAIQFTRKERTVVQVSWLARV
jgi:hypothetical protein